MKIGYSRIVFQNVLQFLYLTVEGRAYITATSLPSNRHNENLTPYGRGIECVSFTARHLATFSEEKKWILLCSTVTSYKPIEIGGYCILGEKLQNTNKKDCEKG